MYQITARFMRSGRTESYGCVKTLLAAKGCADRATNEWPGAYTHVEEIHGEDERVLIAIVHEGTWYIARKADSLF